jgi:hypothetical protein
MAEMEVNQFLTHLAVKEKVSASTQNQALSALLFLYRHVVKRPLSDLGTIIRARRSKRLPVVLTRRISLSALNLLKARNQHNGCLSSWPSGGFRRQVCTVLRSRQRA